METVLERQTIEKTEQERHNAMINERYRRLLDAVEDQISEPTEEISYAPVAEAPVYEVTKAVEETPTVTQYAPSTVAASVFTAERFERMAGFEEKQARVNAPVQTKAIARTSTATSVRYSLTPLAKVAMAIFTMVVIAMLVLIGVNSRILDNKRIKIKNLEQKKEQLTEQYNDLQDEIARLQTEESIIQRGVEAGLI